ncbi:MAG: TolC family protein [Verrucomicrobia bacterium]|nr:TolC family protein [Verrucomicrobiota bacterium]
MRPLINYATNRVSTLKLGLALALGGLVQVTSAPAQTGGTALKRDEYLQRVWAANETIQIHSLEAAIGEERYRAEKGIFEPEFVGGFEAVDRRRPNTTEQIRSLFQSEFNERNRTYSAALESLVPTGAKIRVGYSAQDLNNNLNTGFGNGEWLTTIGVSITQPVLRGGGFGVTLAGIRAAAIGSEISFQDYRRGVMELLTQAEGTYWDLYQTQEQMEISRASLRIAETLLSDNRKRLELGKGAEIDVWQAESGVAQRQAILNEAAQRLATAQSQAATFVANPWTTNAAVLVAADAPGTGGPVPDFGAAWARAYELNPAYVSVLKQAELQGLRVKVARNQRLPQVDLKAGYGFSGIGASPGGSWDNAIDHKFLNLSFGVEMHIPLGGGVKSLHELRGAELRHVATAQAVTRVETSLANSLRAGINSVTAYLENVARYGKVVRFNEDVLKTQLARLDAGKVNSRDVLQAEEDLFRAKISALENMTRYQRAMLELEFLIGSLLKDRQLDLTQKELAQKTAAMMAGTPVSAEKYQQFLDKIRRENEKQRAAPGGPTTPP